MESQHKLLAKKQKPSAVSGMQELSPDAHFNINEAWLWWLVNVQGSHTKMSFQVKQLSSASSTNVNKENIASANMSDEEPQDDQELVNIAAAEKQSGTEHSGTRSGLGAGVFYLWFLGQQSRDSTKTGHLPWE